MNLSNEIWKIIVLLLSFHFYFIFILFFISFFLAFHRLSAWFSFESFMRDCTFLNYCKKNLFHNSLALFLDFKKAFDLINPKLLFLKLFQYGFDNLIYFVIISKILSMFAEYKKLYHGRLIF